MIDFPVVNPRYGFVVLNYNNYQDAIACVESILRITHREDYCIAIVDNASPNNSFEVLKAKFESHPKITLALSNNNNGYSAGNNIGIRILLESGVDYVVIATNDTEVISCNLLDELDKLNLSDVGIVGTDVLTPDGSHQNPPLYRPTILYYLNLYLYEPMSCLRSMFYKFFPFLEQARRSSVANRLEGFGGNFTSQNQGSVYMLHGCFLCLTKHYLDKAGLLDENLFMYGEEDLMAWNCELHGLKRLYLPSIKILHKDGRATKEVYKKDKEEFVRAMTIKSKHYLAKKINKWMLLKTVLGNWAK
jgi:GT2 family glycosyltransferase